jgi:hypothetical protein
MKRNGKIKELLNIQCLNEHDYYFRVLNPLLDYLGIPPGKARWPQFQITTFNGDLKTDFLVIVEDIPMIGVEGKPRAQQFNEAFEQVRFFATNFDPKSDRSIRKQTVPFILVAAGSRAKLYKIAIAPNGIDQEFHPVDGFLEWSELVEEAEHFKLTTAGQLPLEFEMKRKIEATESLISASQARQFLQDVYDVISKIASFKNEDRKIRCLNDTINVAVFSGNADRQLEKYKFGGRALHHLQQSLKVYQEIIEHGGFQGASVAYAYRDFIADAFTGEGFGIKVPDQEGGRTKYKNVGRYLTPKEIIGFMVSLVDVKPSDRVIDFAFGSGGYIEQVIGTIEQKYPSKVESFIKNNIFGCEIDPFSVSTARTFLGFLYPKLKDDIHLFQHNGLYSENARGSEIPEQRGVGKYIQEGTFDIVISNPPGNKKYSGTNAEYVQAKYRQEKNFQDPFLFFRRAIALAKPNGGKICLVVPDGVLSDMGAFQELRNEVVAECELKLIVQLPRIFKHNNAQMSILYAVRNRKWKKNSKVLIVSIPQHTENEEGEREPVNITFELENILQEFKRMSQ